MIPKGTLIIIGGAEERDDKVTDIEERNKLYEKHEILQELIPQKGQPGKIEIITTASDIPDEMKKMYKAAFKKMNFTQIGFIDIGDKNEARKPEYAERVEKAHAVLFSGGNQFKLSATLGGTEIVNVIKEKLCHDKNFIVAGTSAGAMVMAKLMIYEGGVQEAILKSDIQISSGLGILDSCIIDTHFIKRGRFGRLAHAVVMNPEALGIGLGEDTALVIKNGELAECRGSGMAVIIDGNEIGQTNIAEIVDDAPVYVENLKVHLLIKGSRFSIKDRKMNGQVRKENRKVSIGK